MLTCGRPHLALRKDQLMTSTRTARAIELIALMICLCRYANAQTPPGETQVTVYSYAPPSTGTTVVPMAYGIADPKNYYTFRVTYKDVLGYTDMNRMHLMFTQNPLTDLNNPPLPNV